MAALTPHIEAMPEDLGKTVLMPGDPLRSKFIAETFLEDARLINNIRGVQGYTGLYRGVPVTVMASGMGMPSMGIYSHELYNTFGVRHVIRIGSAGSIRKEVKLRDIVLGQGACTDSRFASQFHLPGTFAPICSYRMLSAAVQQAEKLGLSQLCHVGNLISSDCFYGDHAGVPEGLDDTYAWAKMGVMAVEMEAAALYMNAARYGGEALAICTVSDHILTGEKTTAEERQNTFTQMMQLALETAISLE